LALGLVLVITVVCTDGAVGIAKAKLNQRFNITVGNRLVVKRQTSAHSDPQYLFAVGCQDRWTTNGVYNYSTVAGLIISGFQMNKIGSTASLSWDGELVIEKFTESDVGSYEFPTEKPRMTCTGGSCGAVAASVLTIQLE